MGSTNLMMHIPYATSKIEPEDRAAVLEVLDRNYLTRGKAMREFEEKLCEISGKKYAVALSNATVALWAVSRIYNLAEVWSSTLTFSAIANAAGLNNLYLRLVDVDEDTLCGEMSKAWNGTDDALYVPMDYAGYPSLDTPIPHHGGPKTLLDAAHSFGATLVDGKSNTYYADAAVYSFHPAKILTTGEGGAVVTDDERLADELRMLRNNGFKYGTHKIGGLGLNLHLDEMSCALGLSQAKRLPQLLERRREIAGFYYKHMGDDHRLILPAWHPGHSWHLWVTRLSESVKCTVEKFQSDLQELGVGTQRHYEPLSMKHDLGCPTGSFPIAEQAYSRMISIPMYVGLNDNDLTYVCQSISRTLDKYT